MQDTLNLSSQKAAALFVVLMHTELPVLSRMKGIKDTHTWKMLVHRNVKSWGKR